MSEEKDMRILFISVVIIIMCQFQIFAGGEAESGRSQAIDEVSEGQLLPIGSIDPGNYLEDFVYEKSNNSDQPLEFHVDLLKESIWEKGEDISMRISLATNNEKYFRTVPGTCILYVQNPELLKQDIVRNWLSNKLQGYGSIEFLFFDPEREKLLGIGKKNEIFSLLNTLSDQRKMYSNNVLLQKVLAAIDKESLKDRCRVLWITDENIVEKKKDADFFDFAIKVMGTGNITFSYLGYGEVPDWTLLNSALVENNGNSYYAETEKEVLEKIDKDIVSFSKPAVEKIDIEIVWSTYVNELNNFYPKRYYSGISGFSPASNTNRPRTFHSIGGMNYEEDKRYIHYVKIPSLQFLREISENRLPSVGNKFKLGSVYLRYYVPMHDREYFEERNIVVEYRDSGSILKDENRYVFTDTIIQNTPFVIQEISFMVNRRRNYLPAIQLVQTQKKLLEEIQSVRDDDAVAEDIELLDSYYKLLFSQAKTMNMVQ